LSLKQLVQQWVGVLLEALQECLSVLLWVLQ
jgi:hypothetical protein